MPIFEYHCQSCGNDFEKILKTSGEDSATCPECGSKRTRKKISAFSEIKKTSKPCFSGG
ncbi:zinc ribbon domain protein, CxxC_CxxC_SSSS superfamily [Geotalea daltonii FRC-32]|uniref:Zinc ribbon domain protein, CxxC_CxxC_SSSS superfamily n=1 Tax=Geotalea daltonii (strain DSM 22248 / JCM 15807 / FRC-32) TaxID=316067 RepID=A0A068F261_GEODF|nr:zinc ribbon domain protein, CxxC_CxxC_SSSS superfamily [Geotalea daltonii FRC-32]